MAKHENRKRRRRALQTSGSNTVASSTAGPGSELLAPSPALRYVPWILLAAVFLVFGQSLFFEFVDWDDNVNVYENPYLIGLSLTGLRRLWAAPYASLYVPLVYTSYFGELLVSQTATRAIRWLAGPSPDEARRFLRLASAIIHLDNLLLHWLSTWFVFDIVRRTLRGAALPAFIGALLFAVHPIQTESVVWATARKDLLCWALTFAALDIFHAGLAGGLRPARVLLATACFVGALLSKPTAAVFPILAGALAFTEQRNDRRTLLILAGWLVLSCVGYLVHSAPQSDLRDAPFLLDWWKRPFLVADNLLFYFSKLLVPVGLIPIYSRRIADVFASPLVWISLPVVLVAAGALFWNRLTALAAVLIIVPVAPVLGFVPFIYQYFSVVADRYFYGSMAGVALLAALAARKFVIKLSYVPTRVVLGARVGVIAIILLLGGLSAAQALQWRSSEALWRHELAWNPRCVHALYNLASRRAESGKIEEAVQLYERILVVDPYYASAYTNLILLYDQLHRPDQVRMFAEAALELPPNCAENFMARGHALLALGRPQEAAESFRAAIYGLPEDAPAHNSLGMACLALGDEKAAEGAFRQAIQLNPALVPARLNLGKLLQRRGDARGAEAQYRAVLQIDPANAEARQRLQQVAGMKN
jgi:tetratricopeptide (TPR) repeat protein